MKRHAFLPLLAALLISRPASAESPTFEDAVRPILKTYCFECHGEDGAPKGGIDLRLKRLIEKGGKSGPAIIAGNAARSLLLEKVKAGDMPPGKKKLSAAEVARIEKWVAEGAKTKKPEPESLAGGFHIAPEDKAWWAFQPVKRPALPSVEAENPIDRFVRAKLKEAGLEPSSVVDATTLIRRATFDLTGLPPTPEEVDAFLKEHSATPQAAYGRLIDRLLSSPAYGERWGRHWLDVAGYADSEGFTPEDPVRPNAWRYRDYVIRSLNADKPFNQFILEQVAGDELVKPPFVNLKPEDLEKLTAVGFLRMAPDGTGTAGDQKAAKQQVIGDAIKIVSSTFLGLTVGCAQCHNHRYDPIPQTDYYRLRAVVEPGYDAKAVRQVSLATAADKEKAKQIEAEAAKLDTERLKLQEEFIEQTFQKELAKLPEEIRENAKAARNTADAKRSAEQKKLMREHPSLNVSAGSLYLYDRKAADQLKKMVDDASALRGKKPVEEFVRTMAEPAGPAPATKLLYRGDPDQPREEIAPGALSILDEMLPLKIEKAATSSGRRLALAKWLTDPRHPLTSRVLVNRVWLNHFGRGIVNTPGEFGRLGEAPTHSELLDWLAAEFMESGWSLKNLHRLIMTSQAYMQSSKRDPSKDAIDPDNKLLHRANLRRLEAEAVRDAILAASGKLSARPFGPPVPVRENEVGQIIVGKGVKDLARGTVKEEPLPEGEIYRRSLYVQVRRSMPLAVLEAFDAAALEPNCEIRHASTATPQSLLLLNSDFILEQSRFLAERAQKDEKELKAQVRRMWRLAYASDPSESDVATGVNFVEAQLPRLKADKTPATTALAMFAQALLSSNRFLYVD